MGLRSALGAALLLLVFASLFALGGWGGIGDPPKPFATAKGFFVSGIWLQSLAVVAIMVIITAGPAWIRDTADAGLDLLWRVGAVAIVIPVVTLFLWASARFLFGLSAFPPSGFPVSLPEIWWTECALASMGLSLTLSIPFILRTRGHVGIDVLKPILASGVQRTIARLGSIGLALPVGWLLLTKGSSFAARSWNQWEGSQNFGIEFVFLVKTLVPLLGFLIIAVAGLNLRSPDFGSGNRDAGQ